MNISIHVTAILVLALAPLSGYAQSDIDDRFSISLGAFFTDWGTDVRLDSDTLGTLDWSYDGALLFLKLNF